MSFLQPMLLAALPLVALPIIIHLINQRRYQTIRWAAMMFLLAANRMSRGYARIRQWLIMACRMAAIAGLIFAISRPLAGGWLGLTAGGRADTTIVVLDRSPSMQQAGARGARLETRNGTAAVGQHARDDWFGALGADREHDGQAARSRAPGRPPHVAGGESGQLLGRCSRHAAGCARLHQGQPGRTYRDLDLFRHPRKRLERCQRPLAGDPRHVRRIEPGRAVPSCLAYPQTAPGNLSIRVTDVRRRTIPEGAELLVSIKLTREGGPDAHQKVPVQFEIDGALGGDRRPRRRRGRAQGPSDRTRARRERGWGRVSIPADDNPADNDFYFVFEQTVPRRTVIVTDDPQATRPFELAASIAPDPAVKCTAEVITPAQLASVDWDGVALLLWQAPLPEPAAAALVLSFVGRGGAAIFWPTRSTTGTELFGAHWTTWTEQNADAPIESWRGDQDLLAHTQSGTPLPVGKLQIRKYCGLTGELTPLATLKGGAVLLARVTTDQGAVYFCTTTTAPGDSSLASDGVVLYVLVQRALALGATALGSTRQLTAGEPVRDDPTSWSRVAASDEAISTEFRFHRGIYAAGDRLLAVNRSAGEALAPVLADARVSDLFKGLDFVRVDDRAGSLASLINEIWRVFLLAMLVAMLGEAALCLPGAARPGRSAS